MLLFLHFGFNGFDQFLEPGLAVHLNCERIHISEYIGQVGGDIGPGHLFDIFSTIIKINLFSLS